MNNFNMSRFFNFGKYDFTINKSFYRNMVLTTVFGSVGIAIIAFFARWQLANIIIGHTPEDTSLTSLFLLVFCSIMTVIFAGHTFHNLRNKQGRITELTLPSTNIERWTWHVLVSTLGGILALAVGIVCADIINALFNLLVYRGEVNSSISLDVIRTIFFMPSGSNDANFSTNEIFIHISNKNISWALFCLIHSSLFFNICLYIFGNSLKYRYNIIFTYIAEYLVETVIAVLFFSVIIFNGGEMEFFKTMSEEQVETLLKVMYGILIGFYIIAGSALLWGSYKKYCHAQISSRWNR